MKPLKITKRALLLISALLTNIAIYAGEITVSAASSLTNAFQEAAQDFEAKNPDSKVLLNFGGSGALLQQIAKGAPVDVFACADNETMDAAIKQGLVAPTNRRNFAKNTLVLIVPADTKLALKKLDDLTQAAVQRVAIGNPISVPVGHYTRYALQAANLWPQIQAKTISTHNVRQSLDYVARGEVDAGFVYATDALTMNDKVNIAFTVPMNIQVSYPIAPTLGSSHSKEAKRFIEYILSPAGQTILGKYGFQKP